MDASRSGVAGLLAVAAVAGCSAASAQTVRTVRGSAITVPAADPKAYTTADTVFGLDLLGAWCKQDPTANIVLSPSSLESGLGMTFLGARGQTAAAMARVLGLPSDPASPALLAGLNARRQAFNGLNGKGVDVRVTDQVWADKSLPTNRDYLDRTATGYGAGVNLLNILGDPEGARKTINAAISKQTVNRINDLLPENSLSQIGWVLTDAIALDAKWATEFKKESTRPASFTTASGSTVQAQTMGQDEGNLGYAHAGGWTGVSLPYKGGRLSMLALLPDGSGRGCPALDSRTLSTLTGAAPANITLAIPKVKLSSHAKLNDLLTTLGMGLAFSDAADLTGISPRAGKIGFVQHAATLQVDEAGTKAAAATAVGVTRTAGRAPGTIVKFDRPYLLLIRDTRTGEPLFLARVADPTKT